MELGEEHLDLQFWYVAKWSLDAGSISTPSQEDEGPFLNNLPNTAQTCVLRSDSQAQETYGALCRLMETFMQETLWFKVKSVWMIFTWLPEAVHQ